jgi:hypothetical protein
MNVQGKNTLTTISAAKLIASIFGVLSGLGGILHGVGEILQGNVVPDGMFIESWTQGPIAAHMGGDPAMTIVPNLLVTGILALIVSITVIVWSAAYVHRKHGGLILLLLSIVMFLVGGGFGPPTLGLLAGVGGLGINAPYTWWRTHLHAKVQRFLAALWPWVFGVCLINGVFLIIGHVIGVVIFGMTNSAVFLNSFFLAVLLLFFSILTGVAYDIQLIQKNRT